MELLFGLCVALLVISVIIFAVSLASGEVVQAIIFLCFSVAFLFAAGNQKDTLTEKFLNLILPYWMG